MIERIIVARTRKWHEPWDLVWMVRDAEGLVVGFGVDMDTDTESELRMRRQATACFELNFDEPLPEGFTSLEHDPAPPRPPRTPHPPRSPKA